MYIPLHIRAFFVSWGFFHVWLYILTTQWLGSWRYSTPILYYIYGPNFGVFLLCVDHLSGILSVLRVAVVFTYIKQYPPDLFYQDSQFLQPHTSSLDHVYVYNNSRENLFVYTWVPSSRFVWQFHLLFNDTIWEL